MQTRKRAKPVKFGKNKEKEQEEVEIKEEEKASPAAEEITRENIAESIEEARLDDEPEAISLSAPVTEKDEEEEGFDKTSTSSARGAQDKKEEDSTELFDEEKEREDEEKKSEESLEEKLDSPEETKTETEEQEEQPASTFGSFTKQNEPKEKKGSLGFFIMVVIIAFLIGLGGMVGFTYFQDADLMQKVTELTASPTPTPKPTSAPTPTTKSVDKEDYTIKVMNGSGISGLAAESKSELEAAGFTVASIGNADNSDYTSTIIAAKKSVDEAYLTELTKELEKSYKVEIAAKTLPASSGTDIEITLGSSTKE